MFRVRQSLLEWRPAATLCCAVAHSFPPSSLPPTPPKSQPTDNVTIYYSVAPLAPHAFEDWAAGRAAGADDEDGAAAAAPAEEAAPPAKGAKGAAAAAAASAAASASPAGPVAAPRAASFKLSTGVVLPLDPTHGGALTTGFAVTAAVMAEMFKGAAAAAEGAAAAAAAASPAAAQAAWLSSAVLGNYALIRGTLLKPFLPAVPSLLDRATAVVVAESTEPVVGASLSLTIVRHAAALPSSFDEGVGAAAVSAAGVPAADVPAVVRTVRSTLLARDPARLAAEAAAGGGAVAVTVEGGRRVQLAAGTHFFPGGPEALLGSAGPAADAAAAALAGSIGEAAAAKLKGACGGS
jgi:hypothetical protein